MQKMSLKMCKCTCKSITRVFNLKATYNNTKFSDVDHSVDETTEAHNIKEYTKKPTMFKSFKNPRKSKLLKRKPRIETIELDYSSSMNYKILNTDGDQNEIESELPDMIRVLGLNHASKLDQNKSLPLDDLCPDAEIKITAAYPKQSFYHPRCSSENRFHQSIKSGRSKYILTNYKNKRAERKITNSLSGSRKRG